MTGQEPNPAVVPEPEKPATKEYRVVGPHKVLGHRPGSTFRGLLDPAQEQRLIAAHHLELVPEAGKNKEK